jgi:hypothetical protein
MIMLTLAALVLLFFGCSEPKRFGDAEIEARKASLCELVASYELFVDETVKVAGIIEREKLLSRDLKCSIEVFPVGFAFPDSIIGGKAECIGIVFYQEETDNPGFAVFGIRVRPPRRRGSR